MINENKFNFEKIANIVVIVAIMIVTGVIVKKYLFDSNEPIQKLEVGQKVSLPDIDWKQNKTMILATRRDCPHCKSSTTFFRQIIEQANKQNIKVEVVSSDSQEDSTGYLTEINLSTLKTHQLSLNKHGFFGTPTLLFVNQDGIVKDMWVGAVNSDNLNMVINKLNNFIISEPSINQLSSTLNSDKNLSSTQNQITSAELKVAMENRNNILVVDIDSREEFKNLHIANAKNIPSDEIVARASREIPKDKQIVFYGRCPRDSFSSSVQAQLVNIGYANASFLTGGLIGWKGAGLPVENNSQLAELQ
jgi:rhodanese-related sulfurtransferase/peroxiredoxin